MDSYDIFISYSSRDALPHRVCSELEARGLRCWIAPRDIRPGTPYARAIMHGIAEAPVMLVFISRHSLQSDDVLNEVDNAHSLKKNIIPVFIEEIALTPEFSYYLKRRQWINAYNKADSGVADIITAIKPDTTRQTMRKTMTKNMSFVAVSFAESGATFCEYSSNKTGSMKCQLQIPLVSDNVRDIMSHICSVEFNTGTAATEITQAIEKSDLVFLLPTSPAELREALKLQYHNPSKIRVETEALLGAAYRQLVRTSFHPSDDVKQTYSTATTMAEVECGGGVLEVLRSTFSTSWPVSVSPSDIARGGLMWSLIINGGIKSYIILDINPADFSLRKNGNDTQLLSLPHENSTPTRKDGILEFSDTDKLYLYIGDYCVDVNLLSPFGLRSGQKAVFDIQMSTDAAGITGIVMTGAGKRLSTTAGKLLAIEEKTKSHI